MLKYTCLFLFIMLSMAACHNAATTSTSNNPAMSDTTIAKDVHTQSNADKVILKHLDLDIKVDFDTKQISGIAKWSIENRDMLNELKLDT
jgi:leukotriene-A4 hydrolase